MIFAANTIRGKLWWIGIPLMSFFAGWIRLQLPTTASGTHSLPASASVTVQPMNQIDSSVAELLQIAQSAIDIEEAEALLRGPIKRLNLAEVMAVLDHLVNQGSRTSLEYLLASSAFRRLSEIDPFRAMEWVRKREFPLSLHTVIDIPLKAMAAADPDRTFRVLQTFENTELRSTSADVCINVLAETHPEAAWKMLVRLKALIERLGALSELPSAVALNLLRDRRCAGKDEMVFSILQRMSRTDPQSAFQAFKDGRLPMEYYGRWIDHLAVDPEVNLSVSDVAALSQEAHSPTLTAGLFSRFWKTDPDGAWQAVNALADGPTKESARSKLIYEEALKDPAILNKKMPEIASQPLADSTVRQVFSKLAVADPQAAVAAAESLTEPTARVSALTGACLQWTWRNPEGFMDYLQENISGEIPTDVVSATSPDLFAVNFERITTLLQKAPPALRFAAAQAAARQPGRFNEAENSKLAELMKP